MAHGVEARVPYVDPILYDVVRSIPTKMLISRKSNKLILRAALEDRGYRWAAQPKRAFFVPPTSSHVVELGALADDWLNDSMIRKHGVVSPGMVRDSVAASARGDFLASKQVATLAGVHIWLEQGFGL